MMTIRSPGQAAPNNTRGTSRSGVVRPRDAHLPNAELAFVDATAVSPGFLRPADPGDGDGDGEGDSDGDGEGDGRPASSAAGRDLIAAYAEFVDSLTRPALLPRAMAMGALTADKDLDVSSTRWGEHLGEVNKNL